MLDSETAQKILAITQEYWQSEVTTETFRELASGKEIGHRIADLVDERTTELLSKNFTTRRQYATNGKIMPRSMGDIWIHSSGLYNPLNVKAGEAGKNGQPNMVSLKKLLRGLLLHQIDSYYLLIVKMILKGDVRASVYLVDMLDYLDYVTFDSGPGQIMLKERQFYERMEDKPEPAPLTLDKKIERLFDMLEEADRRLLENRERVRATISEMRKTYEEGKGLPVNQSALHLK